MIYHVDDINIMDKLASIILLQKSDADGPIRD